MAVSRKGSSLSNFSPRRKGFASGLVPFLAFPVALRPASRLVLSVAAAGPAEGFLSGVLPAVWAVSGSGPPGCLSPSLPSPAISGD